MKALTIFRRHKAASALLLAVMSYFVLHFGTGLLAEGDSPAKMTMDLIVGGCARSDANRVLYFVFLALYLLVYLITIDYDSEHGIAKQVLSCSVFPFIIIILNLTGVGSYQGIGAIGWYRHAREDFIGVTVSEALCSTITLFPVPILFVFLVIASALAAAIGGLLVKKHS